MVKRKGPFVKDQDVNSMNSLPHVKDLGPISMGPNSDRPQ